MKSFRWIAGLVLLLSVHTAAAETIDLSGGEVVSADIFSGDETERWVGVVGSTYRGDQTFDGHVFAELAFTDSQAGDIVEKDIRGLSGGGYYFMAVPFVDSFDRSRLYGLDNLSSLDKGELFRKRYFPAFYPDYQKYFDAPNDTFTSKSHLVVDGRNLSSAVLELEDNVSYHLLRYNTSNQGIQPAFLAPIDGNRWGEEHEKCYDGEPCDFEFILPKNNVSEDNENRYSMAIFARQPAVDGCGNYGFGDTTYMYASSTGGLTANCLNVSGSTVLDLANNVLEGSGTDDGSMSPGTCAARLSGNGTVVRGLLVENYTAAVCIEDAKYAAILKSSMEFLDYGVRASNSSFWINDTRVEAGKDIVAVNSTEFVLEDVNFSGTEASGSFKNVKIVSGKPPNISANETDLEPIPENLNVTSTESFSYMKELGFDYPPVNRTKVEPTNILQISANESYESGDPDKYKYIVNDLEEIVSYPETGQRFIYTPENITSFSVFQVFGAAIEPRTVTETVTETEREIRTQTRIRTRARVTSRPILVDLNLSRNRMKVPRNRTRELGFNLSNYGKTPTGDIVVKPIARTWSTGPYRIDQLPPGETVNGTVLLEPTLATPLGNDTVVIAVMKNRTALDLETLKVDVVPAAGGGVEVVEAPRFLSLGKKQSQKVGLLVRNRRRKPVNVTVESRDLAPCAAVNGGMQKLEPGESSEITFTARARAEVQECTGLVVLKSQKKVLGFTPVRLTVRETRKKGGLLFLPVVLAVWTVYSFYVVVLNG